ncbi:MAG: glycosyltransferase [Acidobacteria bacterium]|nr:glycosyltransferase [Acidobacteriota bacterium]
MKDVSVVIPTLNAGPLFEETLQKIRAQQGVGLREIVLVDSGSQDGTCALGERYGSAVYRVERFNHGETRNEAVARCTAPFVILTVQDALPASTDWARRLVDCFDLGDRVAGVTGRSAPRENAGLIARWEIQQHYRVFYENSRVKKMEEPEGYRRLPLEQRIKLIAFDNVCSAIRRRVWEEVPFPPARFGEDLAWGKQVLLRGYWLVHEPDATVYHSHDRPLDYMVRRFYVSTVTQLELLEAEPEDFSQVTEWDGVRAALDFLSEVAGRLQAAEKSGRDSHFLTDLVPSQGGTSRLGLKMRFMLDSKRLCRSILACEYRNIVENIQKYHPGPLDFAAARDAVLQAAARALGSFAARVTYSKRSLGHWPPPLEAMDQWLRLGV